MNEAFLLTGGNRGDREGYLAEAARAITRDCGQLLRSSSLYETEAWGMEDQEPFLNQVLQIHTALAPADLLDCLLQIENALGRKREQRYGPRTIDIDILFYNDLAEDQPGLHIPHPRIQERRFVLEPLNEIAPDKIHPLLRKTIRQMLADCSDTLSVNKFS